MSEQIENQVEDENELNLQEEIIKNDEGENPESVEDNESEEEGELIVQFGEDEKKEDEKEHAPAWVKELRKQNREQAKRLKEFEQRESERTQSRQQALRAKPTLEDHDYDPDAFEQDLILYNEEKRAIADQEKANRTQQEQQQRDWEETVRSFEDSKKTLKVADYQDKQEEVETALSQVQQGIILAAAKQPALFVYGLGSNHSKLQELKQITDPIKFTAAIVRLEESMKQTTKKAPPPAEKTLTGNAAHSGSSDKALERLRADAEKNGDYSKVVAYKSRMKKPK